MRGDAPAADVSLAKRGAPARVGAASREGLTRRALRLAGGASLAALALPASARVAAQSLGARSMWRMLLVFPVFTAGPTCGFRP